MAASTISRLQDVPLGLVDQTRRRQAPLHADKLSQMTWLAMEAVPTQPTIALFVDKAEEPY